MCGSESLAGGRGLHTRGSGLWVQGRVAAAASSLAVSPGGVCEELARPLWVGGSSFSHAQPRCSAARWPDAAFSPWGLPPHPSPRQPRVCFLAP